MKYDRSYSDPYEHKDPKTTSEEVIVVEQHRASIPHHEMTEKEFKSNCQNEPNQTKSKGILTWRQLQPLYYEPDIDPKEHCEAYSGQLMGVQFI